MELTEKEMIELHHMYIGEINKGGTGTTKFLKFKGRNIEISVYKPKSNHNDVDVEKYIKNIMKKEIEPDGPEIECLRGDVKHLSDESLMDCIELAKISTEKIAPVILSILMEEFELRKSQRGSESWLDDVFGGE